MTRSSGATPAIIALERAGVEHTVHPYEIDDAPGSTFGEAVAAALGVDPARLFKTLVARIDGDPVVAIVPVDGTLDTKALARAVGGKRASMAEASDAERLTGFVVGGISPLGQRRRMRTIVDTSLIDHATVFVSAGRRGLQVELSPADLVAMTGAEAAVVAARRGG